MLKKITTLILLIFILFITSCTEVVTTCTVTVNDGTNTTEYTINKGDNLTFLESPTKFKHQFAGWYNGDKLINVNNPVEEDLSIEANFEYVYNQTGFDGNGMEYNILVFDEFNKTVCRKNNPIVDYINSAYNINVVFTNYTTTLQGNLQYYTFLYSDYKTVYPHADAVVGMNVGTLVNSKYNELYPGKLSEFLILDDGTDNSIFKQYGYTQSEFASSQVTVDGNVYGYNPNVEYKYNGLMEINKEVIKEYNLEDPYEMYLNGEWTFSNFQKWIDDANEKIDRTKTLLVGGIEYNALKMYMNFAAALGYPLAEEPTQTSLSAEIEEHYDLADFMNNLHFMTYQGYGDNKKTIVNYLICDVDNYEGFSREEFYFLPYPMADDQQGELILSNDSNNAQYNVYGNAITDDNGNYITAIDLTNTTFKINVSNFNNSYFIRKVNDNDFGLTDDISFEIIYDLFYFNNLVNEAVDSYNNLIDIIYELSSDSGRGISNYICDNIIKYSNCYYDQTLSIGYKKYSHVTYAERYQDAISRSLFTKEHVLQLLNFEWDYWMRYEIYY